MSILHRLILGLFFILIDFKQNICNLQLISVFLIVWRVFGGHNENRVTVYLAKVMSSILTDLLNICGQSEDICPLLIKNQSSNLLIGKIIIESTSMQNVRFSFYSFHCVLGFPNNTNVLTFSEISYKLEPAVEARVSQ